MGNLMRPTKYTQKIADEICSRISGGESLRSLCREEEKGKFAIYVLCDPSDGRVRYVGRTCEPKRRFNRHCQKTHAGSEDESRRAKWLESLRKRGLKPEMIVIDWDDDWDVAERFWIKVFRNVGCDLVNGNDGGNDIEHVRRAECHGEWHGKWTPLQRIRNDIKSTISMMRKAGKYDRADNLCHQLDLIDDSVRDICKRLGKKTGKEYINRMLAMRRPYVFGRA